MSQRAAIAALGAVILAFLAGLIGQPILQYHYDSNSERFKAEQHASMQRYDALYSKLREDPEICLREKWYKKTDERYSAYQHSIMEQDVNYSASTLGRLYDFDQMNVRLLEHPSFDQHLLEREFHKVLKQSLQGGSGCDKLVHILQNPNAKEEWFAEIVSAEIIDKDIVSCSDSLRNLIERRQMHQKSEAVPPNGP